MYLLAFIIYLPFILLSIAVWAFVIFALFRARKAWRTKAHAALIFWCAIVLAPFMLFYGQRALADIKEADRAREVAAFERHSMPTAYPRLLEVYGHLTTHELLIYLDTLKIDQIMTTRNRARKDEKYAQVYTLNPNCRGRGQHYLAEWERRGRFRSPTKEDKDCLNHSTAHIEGDRASIPAIEFLVGKESTKQIPGNTYSPGAYEVRIRSGGGESIMLDYWERPYIQRPMIPLIFSPTGFLIQGNTDSRDYKQPKRLDFFGGAVGVIKKSEKPDTT